MSGPSPRSRTPSRPGSASPRLLEAEPAFAPYRGSSAYRTSLELARRNQHPCAGDPDHRAFDFFIGHWRAATPDGMVAGTNHIEAVLGGAALIERWTSTSTATRARASTGSTRVTGTWRQTWVDDQGDVVEFVDGHIDDGAMRFVAHGDGVDRRLTFFHQGPDALRQLSEASERRRRDVVDRVRPALPAPGRGQTVRHWAGWRARGRRLTGRAAAVEASGGRATRTRRGPREQPDAGADLGRRVAPVVDQQVLVARRVVAGERERLDRDPERPGARRERRRGEAHVLDADDEVGARGAPVGR